MADDVSIRPITDDILGTSSDANNLIKQTIPSIALISEATFRPGDPSNTFEVTSSMPTVGRVGIFAAKKGSLERAVILLLPATGAPDCALIAITQGFAQAERSLGPLHWENPLSPALIKFCLLKHVVNRWGAQMLASRKRMAFVYIVRARGKELGPFANDGRFVVQALTEIASLTNDAFSLGSVEAFTFSSGIGDFNVFLNSISGALNVRAVYNIDPAHATSSKRPEGSVRKQYLSGSTGGQRAGFEFLPLNRWRNEFRFQERETFPTPWQFNYLHNHCMPLYILHLALQTS